MSNEWYILKSSFCLNFSVSNKYFYIRLVWAWIYGIQNLSRFWLNKMQVRHEKKDYDYLKQIKCVVVELRIELEQRNERKEEDSQRISSVSYWIRQSNHWSKTVSWWLLYFKQEILFRSKIFAKRNVIYDVVEIFSADFQQILQTTSLRWKWLDCNLKMKWMCEWNEHSGRVEWQANWPVANLSAQQTDYA